MVIVILDKPFMTVYYTIYSKIQLQEQPVMMTSNSSYGTASESTAYDDVVTGYYEHISWREKLR